MQSLLGRISGNSFVWGHHALLVHILLGFRKSWILSKGSDGPVNPSGNASWPLESSPGPNSRHFLSPTCILPDLARLITFTFLAPCSYWILNEIKNTHAVCESCVFWGIPMPGKIWKKLIWKYEGRKEWKVRIRSYITLKVKNICVFSGRVLAQWEWFLFPSPQPEFNLRDPPSGKRMCHY